MFKVLNEEQVLCPELKSGLNISLGSGNVILKGNQDYFVEFIGLKYSN